MPKFNTAASRPPATSPVKTEAIATGRTHEGGAGYARDAKSELFLLAVTNMVGENTYYEQGKDRDARFVNLVRVVAVEDVGWLTRFLLWLRLEANMRSAPIQAALEAVRARLASGIAGGNRQLVASVLQRADEPAEALAYWISRYGRAVPKPIRRGIGDAILRLGNEFNYVKWDSEGKGVTFADLLNLTHPGDRKGSSQAGRFQGLWQHDLFGYIVKKPHDKAAPIPETLGLLTRREALLALPLGERRQVLDDPELLRRAGITWEALAGWLQGPMDAAAWEAIIPSMGLMALTRNLRNFDEAGVSDIVAATVAARLANAEEVRRSRQFPFRFLAAYKHAPSLRWSYPLEQALAHSLANVPALAGRTLILVDRSGSMFDRISEKSQLNRADSAAVFGAALALRAENADLVQFGTNSQPISYRRGESVLKVVERFGDLGGTNTAHAVRRHFRSTVDAHNRVIIITDEQTSGGYYGSDPTEQIPAQVPVYTWNLAGHKHGHAPSGVGTRHTFGGLSDAAFKLIPILEARHSAGWPF
ncbi:TROVE domain-containing protein [Nonomuraea sp. NPDC049758]|uniref:TROVE domain-containing protein n=1 Tax=Nonomuraea sp. NPDC049758 TaxID=3154360 RepID=UPI003445F310